MEGVGIAMGLLLLGVGLGVLVALATAGIWVITALYHAAKPDRLPGAEDSRWDREQGREPQ